MPRLTPVSWQQLVKRLSELGFEGPYAGGRHPQMRRADLTLMTERLKPPQEKHISAQHVSAKPPAASGFPPLESLTLSLRNFVPFLSQQLSGIARRWAERWKTAKQGSLGGLE